MKKNPFTKSVDGIGPGPGDMAQARIRAMTTIARQTAQAKIDSKFDKEPVRRGYTPPPHEVQCKEVSDTSPAREAPKTISKSKGGERRSGFRWLRRLWAARG